jgi:hypothetical protein
MSAFFGWLNQYHEFANALATIFSALTAAGALAVSGIALRSQRRHDVMSVRPIPEVTVADYEDSLRIKLRNNGVGPMVIRAVMVTRDGAIKGSVIEWMPSLPGGRPWNHFATDLLGRTLRPDGAIPLLELTQGDGEAGFAACRDLVRRALRGLVVEVEFSDVYETTFPRYSKSLEWFGRNIGGGLSSSGT